MLTYHQKRAIEDYKIVVRADGKMAAHELIEALKSDEAFHGATDEAIEFAAEKIQNLENVECATKSKPKPQKYELEKLYLLDELTTMQIGEMYNVTSSTVVYWLKKCGIPSRRRGWKRKNGGAKLMESTKGQAENIEELKEELESIDGEIEDIEFQILGLEDEVFSLQNRKEEINEKIKEIEASEEHQEMKELWEDRIVILPGQISLMEVI